MTGLSLRNPIAILMIAIGLVVFSGVVTPRMSVDTFPELTPPVLVVGTLAPGLGPKDVEKTLTWRIEKYVSATPGVDHVESVSRNNLSIVYVWLKWGTDLNSAQTLVQQQTAFAMSAVPKSLGVLPPFVLQYDPSNAPVVQIAVSGGGLSGPQLYDYALNNIEPVIEGIPGVASASLNGGRQRQINIVVDPVAAQARGVTSGDISAAVAQSNALLPSGVFISPKFDANVYTNAVPDRVATIGNAIVKLKDGNPVLIRDVARVEDGGSPETQSVSVNGRNAVYLNVLRVPGGNTLEIVDSVKKAVAGLKDLPPGVEVKAVFDQSTFVRTSYEGLRKEILQALLLIGLVILVFLQNPRAVLIAAIAIPISFGIILLVLYAAGQTLNAFTLGGLTLAMGPLVDISVVVLESVHRHRTMGKSAYAAALDGARAVAVPTLAATMTTTAVLLPVLLLSGLAKKLFAPLALTVAVGMFAGYFVSMTITPVACRYLFGHHKKPGRIASALEGAVSRVAEGYATLLRAVVPYRLVVLLAAAALVAGSGWAAMRLPSTFFPEIDESMERVYVRLAPGTSLEDASKKIAEMGKTVADELPKGNVELVLTNVGSPNNARSAMTSPNNGPHMGFIRLALVDAEKRTMSQREIADKMREILNRNYPGVEFLQWPGGLVASVFANGYIAPLVVEVRGDNLAELNEQARAVAEVARSVPGIRDIRVSLQTDYPEVRVETVREQAGLVGVTSRDAAQTTLEATLGNINTPSVWIDPANGQSYYVVTYYDGKAVTDPNALAQIPVRISGEGKAVPLGAYGQVRRSVGPIAIERNQLQRAAHVLMQTEGRDIGSAAEELEKKLHDDPRTRNVKFEYVGQVQLMRNTFSGLGLAIGLAVMVVFMIMAAQFKSLRLPFVMLFTIPVSLVGIVMALMAAGQGFSITALMGMLMVVGIAVSNGILLVDDANRRFSEGTEKVEAIILAARSRFVPIAMTSLATVIGLLPTAIGLEKGTEANQPLALAVVGGLTSSTILSLFLVPAMFLYFAKRPVKAEAEDTSGGSGGQAVTGTSLRNPIAILMIAIGLLVFAAVVTPRMSVDTFPELTPPVLVVGTLAPGLGPKDVEKTLTWRIEKYVSATPGVDHVESVSRNNLSIVYVWLKWGTDLNSAQTLVQQQTAFAMSAVPKSLGVLPPFVLQYDPSNAPVVQVAVSGGGLSGPQLYDYALNNIEPILEGIPGVASASLNGGRQRQINVVVDPVAAQSRGVTSSQIASAVSKSNALLPSGVFISPNFDANVYTNAVPERVSTIGNAVVKLKDGRPILIRDVARVEDGGSPETQSVSVNGLNAVYLNVLRVPGGNTLDIVDAVKKAVGNLKDLPPGVEVKAVFDQSTFVRTTYQGLRQEVVQALVLIALVILVFLQSVRGTLIVSVAIPLSFAITLIVLYATGQTLNAFTLGGLTLAMGRLVDDAVVVLESIHRHQRMGMSTQRAALEGTSAVALPVLASTLTTMAVLLPVLLLAGLAKKLFAPLALTVAVAMTASYFVSVCVTPVACRYFLGHSEHGRFGKLIEAFIDRVAQRYSQVLRVALPYRWTIIAACALLTVGAGWAAGRLPSTFFPEIDESMERVYVRLAPGTSLEDASKKIAEMGKTVADELPKGNVELVLTNVGSPNNARSAMTSPNNGPHMGFIRLALVDAEKRTMSQREIADKMREILNRNYPGVEFLQWPGGLVASVFANGYIAPLAVEVRGDNLAELNEQARAVAEVARSVPGIRDIRVSLQTDYPEVRVETVREQAGLVGVTSRDAAQTTLEATLGNINTPSVWIDPANGQSYYVVTYYDGKAVTDPNALAQIPVRISGEGKAVPLGAYGQVRRSVGPIAIERNQLQRAAHVLMQTEGRDIGSAAEELEKKLHDDPRTRNVKFEYVGQVQLMRNTFSGLGLAIGLAVMVVFMIMAAQFKSLRLPFVMLFTIPVSLVGIVMALMAAGQGFSITALMGILMVVGIAVSNGILLVDDANRRFSEGVDKMEAVIAAARSRFVPIAMTSLATVIGLIPTAIGLEKGTEANQPLALAVVGGLTSSTILSLFLVPVMFMFFAKRSPVTDEETAAPAALAETHA